MTVQAALLRALFCTCGLLFSVSVLPVSAHGQTPNALDSASVGASSLVSSTPDPASSTAPSKDDNHSCSRWAVQNAQSLTFKQRSCFYGSQLIAPQFAIQAVATAAIGRYSILDKQRRMESFPLRLETYYARHSAQDAAELLVGYLHHEDPRSRTSGAKGVFRRTNLAMLSVVASPDEDGHLRPAFVPVAGSFGSALVGTAMSRRDQDLSSLLFRAGRAYGFYFARAICTEFKPEMMGLMHKFWH